MENLFKSFNKNHSILNWSILYKLHHSYVWLHTDNNHKNTRAPPTASMIHIESATETSLIKNVKS